ncbi:MAG: ABC transporter permease [Chitinophagales bacterium]
MFRNYFKTAIRNLWKNKTYSFLNIFGLAIGITCASLIFLWVEDELSFNHQHLKRNNLYQLMENQHYDGKTYTFAATPGQLGPVLKSEIPGILNTFRMTWNQTVLFSLGDKSIHENGFYADSNMFSMLSLPFVEGKPDHVFKDLHSLVISEKMAKKFFPNNFTVDGKLHDVLGKTLKVDNKEDYVITGVVKDIPENNSIRFDWLAPFQIYYDKNNWTHQWGANGVQTFAEVSPKSSPDVIDKKIYGYIQTKEKDAVARLFLLSMNDWHLRSNFEDGKKAGGLIVYVRMFTIIAWIILLIGCINFMNLATARSEKRAREVGVRKVLGAARQMLIGQFISEAILMAFLSVLISLLMIYLILPSFNSLVQKQLLMDLASPLHISALVLIIIVCGLIAGSYPALYLSSFNPVSVFKGIKIKSGSASLIRKGLVILQFTISIILIISTIIIFQQIQYVKNRDLGYNKDNLVRLGVEGDLIKHFASVRQDLLSTGHVENASLAMLDMLEMGSNTSDFTWQGKDPNKKILITEDAIDPQYLPTIGLHLKYGRNFYPVPEQDSLSFIINETLAALMGKEKPIGETITWDTTRFHVIGVVKDFVYGDMYKKSDPLIFFCKPGWADLVYVKLKSNGSPEKALTAVEKVFKQDNPGYPFDYRFVNADFDAQFKTETLIGKLSRVFASLAIIISCLGLFGLAAYMAERRTKEIGIRKVLGASVARITRLLSKDFLQLVIISAIIAFPFSWWAMHQWLQNYAYRIQINWWVFVVAGILALMIAIFTISFQAIRAAVANPVRNLRTE